ncbi:MAG: hypothetical protein R3B48_22585 [Kofleriaceae bacterium]
MDDLQPSAERPEPSILIIGLHLVMWTVLVCGLVMMMVVIMLN